MSQDLGRESKFTFEISGDYLLLPAKKVDTVVESHMFNPISIDLPTTNEEISNNLRAWLLSYQGFINHFNDTRPDLEDIWWRIPICDRTTIMIRGLWNKDEKHCFNELLAQVNGGFGTVEIGRETTQYRDRMIQMITGRLPFMTSSGRPGLGPSDAHPNDEVFLVVGSQVPLLLRPNSHGSYRLIGEVYVHDLDSRKLLKQEPSARIIRIV